jgi:hypothetical protein
MNQSDTPCTSNVLVWGIAGSLARASPVRESSGNDAYVKNRAICLMLAGTGFSYRSHPGESEVRQAGRCEERPHSDSRRSMQLRPHKSRQVEDVSWPDYYFTSAGYPAISD